MSTVQNVLFIMADQLRADHLSCYCLLYTSDAADE